MESIAKFLDNPRFYCQNREYPAVSDIHDTTLAIRTAVEAVRLLIQ